MALGVTLALGLAACGGSKDGGSSPGGSGDSVDTLVHRQRRRGGHTRPGPELGQRVDLAGPEHLQPARVSRTRTAPTIVPDLATSWDISDDSLTYTFHLRDAKFSDGSPVTGLRRGVLDQPRERPRGRLGLPHDRGHGRVTAPDDKTVVITLSQPHAPLLADLAMYAYSVVPEKQVEAEADNFFTKPVGSGPFMVTSYQAESEVDFDVNPNWYGDQAEDQAPEDQDHHRRQHPRARAAGRRIDMIENPPGNMVDADQLGPEALRRTCSPRPASTSSVLHQGRALRRRAGAAGRCAGDRPGRDEQARLPGHRDGRDVVHALQDAVLGRPAPGARRWTWTRPSS